MEDLDYHGLVCYDSTSCFKIVHNVTGTIYIIKQFETNSTQSAKPKTDI